MDDRAQQSMRSGSTLPTLYAAGVIGLTAFIACTLLFPEPIRSYRVQAALGQTAATSESKPVELPIAQLAEVEFIARQAFQSLTDPTSKVRPAFVDSVSYRLERPAATQAQLIVETRDRHADKALALAERIADEILQRQPDSMVPELNALRSQQADVQRRLALVRESRATLETDLRGLEHEHLADLSAALQRVIATEEGKASAISKEAPSGLEVELQTLLASRRELALTRTDDHPQVKEVDERLADLKNRLQAMAPSLRSVVSGTAATPASKTALQQLDRTQENFRLKSSEARQAITEARGREEQLVAEEVRLATLPPAVAIHTTISQEPRIVERIGGQPSAWRLSIFLMLSLTLAGSVYGALYQLTAKRRLCTAEDIRSQLGVPVVSMVGQQSLDYAALRIQRLLRRSILATEILLLVLAIAAFSLVNTQRQLARPVGADPLGALAESMDRTFSPTLRR